MRIQWKPGAFYKLRSDPGVVADLEKRAARVAAAAGEGFETGSQQGAKRPQGRWRTSVVTATPKAMRSNAKNHTLLKSLDAAR